MVRVAFRRGAERAINESRHFLRQTTGLNVSQRLFPRNKSRVAGNAAWGRSAKWLPLPKLQYGKWRQSPMTNLCCAVMLLEKAS